VRLGRGLRDKEIAAELDLSVHTVRNYIAAARAKFNAANRTQLVALARE